ncbi:radical SAM protein [bacterium]|nr:radical SAM protein [bacterium]
MSENRGIPEHLLHDILPLVDHPVRYIGGERGSVLKDFDNCTARIALAFPDVYEIASGNLGQEILYHILNSHDDYLAERVYAPWTDFEKQLEKHSIPLYTLENKIPVKEFDLIALTVSYELGYTGILTILNSSGLPLKSSERGFPIVGMGGSCAFNPAVMSDYIDFFHVGDGEKSILKIAGVIAEYRNDIDNRSDYLDLKRTILERLAEIPGMYVPILGKSANVRAIVPELESDDFPACAIIPYFGDMKNRITLEVFRGCTQGCRFCQAGYIYRPYRKRSVGQLIALAHESFAHSGHSAISLSSLNTTDYPELIQLVEGIIELRGNRPLKISIPSSRITSFNDDLAKVLKPYSSGSLTLAIEAGTERLRKVINKHTSDDKIFDAVRIALKNGLGKFKLYFMIGLPTETMEDIESIIDIMSRIRDIQRELKRNNELPPKTNFQLKVAVANFVPKPYTPFQWCEMDSIETMVMKHVALKPLRSMKSVRMKYHSAEGSFLEGVISRGDGKVGKVIETAWRMGSRFESWKELLDLNLWLEAFKKENVNPDDYNRRWDLDEDLPWDVTPFTVNKKFLQKEYEKALNAKETPDCFESNCAGCGLWKEVCVNLPRGK